MFYAYRQEKTHRAPQEGAACAVGPASSGSARDPYLSVLRTEIQIKRLGQSYVPALSGGAMAGYLNLARVHSVRRRRMDTRTSWACIAFLSAIGWGLVLMVLL